MNDEATYLKYAAQALRNAAGWFEELSRLRDQQATTEASTRVSPSAVQGQASTEETIPPSSLSATRTEDAGPAGPGCGCAHRWSRLTEFAPLRWDWQTLDKCIYCPAFRVSGQILVPVAEQDTLISQRPASSPSASALSRAEEPSLSASLVHDLAAQCRREGEARHILLEHDGHYDDADFPCRDEGCKQSIALVRRYEEHRKVTEHGHA